MRDPNFDAYVMKIYRVLERLDYYRLLGIDPKAGVSEIRKAFYAIAAKFHPDRNRDAAPDVKKAIYDIFKRLNEAYRVLLEPEKRKLYDKSLAKGKVRLEQDMRKTSVPKNPEDTIKSREARQFYRHAVDEFKKGSLMTADLHIKVAKAREPKNKVIDKLFKQIMKAKAEAKAKKKRSGKK
jgi:DnaJ-class molecular chaperone